MEKSFFFNAVVKDGVPDRTYSADDIAEREALIFSDGILGGDSLKVEAVSAAGVYVRSGGAILSGYTYICTEDKFLSVSAGHFTLDRIDTVALRLDLESRKIAVVMLKGTPSAHPVSAMPEDTDTVKYLPLADIFIPSGADHVVETEDITDRRVLSGFNSSKEEMFLLLREYLGEIDPINSSEIKKMREVISFVNKESGNDRVLCGDGIYRKANIFKRVVAEEYTEPGEYYFSVIDNYSVSGFYDIEVQAGGGAGGSYNGLGSRGGGGGGGGFVTASNLYLRQPVYKVVVGAGGAGVPGGSGEDGGDSSFGGYIAKGGRGGGGGSLAAGGNGGEGLCIGGRGNDGMPKDGGAILSNCGKGGDSQFGIGAYSAVGDGSVQGNDAEFPGTGGSGATAAVGTFGKAGGAGANGRVIIYKYVPAEEGETE